MKFSRRLFMKAAESRLLWLARAADHCVGFVRRTIESQERVERREAKRLLRHLPRAGEHLRILDGRLDLERLGVDAPVPLDDVQRVRMKRDATLGRNPGVVGEI